MAYISGTTSGRNVLRTEWVGAPNIVAGTNTTAIYTVQNNCFLTFSFKMDHGHVENPYQLFYAPPNSDDFKIVMFSGEVYSEGDCTHFYMPCQKGSRFYLKSRDTFDYDDPSKTMENDWYSLANPIAWIEIY